MFRNLKMTLKKSIFGQKLETLSANGFDTDSKNKKIFQKKNFFNFSKCVQSQLNGVLDRFRHCQDAKKFPWGGEAKKPSKMGFWQKIKNLFFLSVQKKQKNEKQKTKHPFDFD